jgi:hypothetical protein
LEKDLIVDLVGEIADEDVEVVRRVFLGRVVRLVGPVDANFLFLSTRAQGSRAIEGCTYVVVHAAAVEGRHCAFGGCGVVKFHEAVVEAFLTELRSKISLHGLWDLVSQVGATGAWPGQPLVKGRSSLTFLSGMIFTLWTWPVVSKI